MATSRFGLLDEREENELHKSRLLNVEEKPFKRLTKRLVAPGSFTNPGKLPPTPPPDGEGQDAAVDVTALKEDIILDFEAFDAQILRLQLLGTANEKERDRYAADRVRILETMESVREGNARLKAQLDEARATLAQRRKFDELADRITSNRMLRPRHEQAANLAKLAEECDGLHRESETYGATWRERREQFERLVEEGKRLRALIRDEKEEVERREGMDESDAEDGEAAATPGNNNRGSVSGNATPHPDSGAVSSKGEGGNATPRPSSRGERTPRPGSSQGEGASAAEGGGGLKPRPDASGSFSRSGSQAPSQRADSQQPREEEMEEGEDVEMGESSAQLQQLKQEADTPMADEMSQETPQITIEAPGDTMDTT